MTDAEDGLELASMERLRDPACPPRQHTSAPLAPAQQDFRGELAGPPGRQTALGEGRAFARQLVAERGPAPLLTLASACLLLQPFRIHLLLDGHLGGMCMRERRRGNSRPE